MSLVGYRVIAVNPAIELINTQAWYGRGPGMIDRLEPTGSGLRFLERAGLSGPGEATAAEHARLIELRALLRRLTTLLSGGGSLSDADVDELNRYLETPVARRYGPDGLRVVPIRSDWPWAMSEIAASFAALLNQEDMARLKVCSNPECQWAFYDGSKNRSRRWCFATACGNVAKVRAYRQRNRALSDT